MLLQFSIPLLMFSFLLLMIQREVLKSPKTIFFPILTFISFWFFYFRALSLGVCTFRILCLLDKLTSIILCNISSLCTISYLVYFDMISIIPVLFHQCCVNNMYFSFLLLLICVCSQKSFLQVIHSSLFLFHTTWQSLPLNWGL